MIARTAAALTSVLIVDGDVLVREGIAAQLERHNDLHVVAGAATAGSAVDEAERHRPDIAILDADLTLDRCVNLCSQIKVVSPETRCIIHAATASTDFDSRGADAVVLKQLLGDGLADTIHHIIGPKQ